MARATPSLRDHRRSNVYDAMAPVRILAVGNSDLALSPCGALRPCPKTVARLQALYGV